MQEQYYHPPEAKGNRTDLLGNRAGLQLHVNHIQSMPALSLSEELCNSPWQKTETLSTSSVFGQQAPAEESSSDA